MVMVLNIASTDITFAPFVGINNETPVLTVEVWDDNTKTKVSASNTATKSGSKYTVALPDLSSIDSVAQAAGQLLVRVFYDTYIIFEAKAYWVTGQTGLFTQWKQFDETAPSARAWKTIQ